MSYMWTVRPESQDEKRVIGQLNQLAVGHAICDIKADGPVRVDNKIHSISKSIKASRDMGRATERKVNWIVGDKGAGKTEALYFLKNELCLIEDDHNKTITTLVNLKEGGALSGTKLEEEIFRNLFLHGNNPIKRALLDKQDEIEKYQAYAEFSGDIIGLGAEIAFFLCQLPVPTASFFVTTGWKKLWRFFAMQKRKFLSALEKAGLTDIHTQSIFDAWVSCFLNPSISNAKKLKNEIERSAENNKLFNSICKILSARYCTLTILIDEFDRTNESSIIPSVMERFWDIGKKENIDMNLHFVIGSSFMPGELEALIKHTGFKRRFIDDATVIPLALPTQHDVEGCIKYIHDACHSLKGVSATEEEAYFSNAKTNESLIKTELQNQRYTWSKLWVECCKYWART